MRTIKNIYTAVSDPIGDLVTYRAMPTQEAPMNLLDPFIFLNHHGWQQYPAHNNGLPFGPHPHRGFQTVTFILEGDLMHKDSSGATSTINAGGVQWMTAGSGLVHSEISSDEFLEKGGPLEILQLWINLPARFKMTAPKYKGLQKNEIPTVQWDNGKVTAHIVSGNWDGVTGNIEPLTNIMLAYIDLNAGGAKSFFVPKDMNVLFYVVKGSLNVNGRPVTTHNLVSFGYDDETIEVTAISDSLILFGYATPFNEPFVAYGPFVMNTREEIMEAYDDYRKGKFGSEENF